MSGRIHARPIVRRTGTHGIRITGSRRRVLPASPRGSGNGRRRWWTIDRCEGSATVLTLTTERAQRSAKDQDDPFRLLGSFFKEYDPIPLVAQAHTGRGFGIVRAVRP